jgi:hypothetical protein
VTPQITVGNEAYPQNLGLHPDEQALFAARLSSPHECLSLELLLLKRTATQERSV